MDPKIENGRMFSGGLTSFFKKFIMVIAVVSAAVIDVKVNYCIYSKYQEKYPEVKKKMVKYLTDC